MSARLREILTVFLAVATSALADVRILLPDSEAFAEGDGSDFFVETTMPGTAATPDAILRALLAPGMRPANPTLSTPFFPDLLRSSSHFEGAGPLAGYFRGARWKGTTIVLSFDEEAMRYLNNTVSIQEFVKGAIEGTLRLNFPHLKKVEYEIDGRIVRDWDA